RGARDDQPVLRTARVGLVRQPVPRLDLDPLDLVAVTDVQDVPGAPRTRGGEHVRARFDLFWHRRTLTAATSRSDGSPPPGRWQDDAVPDAAVPQHCPTPRELDDLELLTTGALAPI